MGSRRRRGRSSSVARTRMGGRTAMTKVGAVGDDKGRRGGGKRKER